MTTISHQMPFWASVTPVIVASLIIVATYFLRADFLQYGGKN
jgi:hypothetical protein